MKLQYLISFIVLGLLSSSILAQEDNQEIEPKVKWYFAPEYSMIMHQDDRAHAVGLESGISILKERLQIGIFYYGRSGPINQKEFAYTFPQGTTYKGKNGVKLGADHVVFGLSIAPQFKLYDGKIILDIPLRFGQMSAGYYLKDEDRNTPDGRRVSEWEDDLFNGMDAGSGWMLEGGVRIRFRLFPKYKIEAGIGILYSHTLGWETEVGGSNYYNVPRMTFFVQFGN